jgi:hypothetical protein
MFITDRIIKISDTNIIKKKDDYSLLNQLNCANISYGC